MFDKMRFDDWMDNPVTQALMELIKNTDEHIVEVMLHPETISADNGHIILSRLSGQREVLQRLTTLEFEDLDNQEEEEDNE